ncbi:hypothetical protein LguiA_005027 [Lonicera macranthoides]
MCSLPLLNSVEPIIHGHREILNGLQDRFIWMWRMNGLLRASGSLSGRSLRRYVLLHRLGLS